MKIALLALLLLAVWSAKDDQKVGGGNDERVLKCRKGRCPKGYMCYEGICLDMCMVMKCINGYTCIRGKCVKNSPCTVKCPNRICIGAQCLYADLAPIWAGDEPIPDSVIDPIIEPEIVQLPA